MPSALAIIYFFPIYIPFVFHLSYYSKLLGLHWIRPNIGSDLSVTDIWGNVFIFSSFNNNVVVAWVLLSRLTLDWGTLFVCFVSLKLSFPRDVELYELFFLHLSGVLLYLWTIYNSYLFVHNESSFYLWNKTNLFMVFQQNSVCWKFIESFCVGIH